MAARTNSEELRRQSLSTLAEGRAEISAEMHRLRMQLSPARVLHRTVARHTRLAVFSAFVAGMVPALMFRRGKPSLHSERRPVALHGAKPETRPAMTPQLLGVLARAVTPTLVKSVLASPLLKLLIKKPSGAVQNKPLN